LIESAFHYFDKSVEKNEEISAMAAKLHRLQGMVILFNVNIQSMLRDTLVPIKVVSYFALITLFLLQKQM